MIYILDKGDNFEKPAWELFAKDRFSNYNLFLEKYIHPVTQGNNHQLNFCMLHYSILRNFHYIYLNIDKLQKQQDIELFKNIIIRLGSIIDLTNEFIFHFLIDKGIITLDEVSVYCDSIKKIKLEETTKYVNAYNDANGIVLNLFDKERIINHFSKKSEKDLAIKDIFNDLTKLFNPIRKYRNVLVHSYFITRTSDNRYPPIELLDKFFIRNTLKLKKVRLANPNFGNDKLSNFKYQKDLVEELCSPLIEKINLMWGKLNELAN